MLSYKTFLFAAFPSLLSIYERQCTLELKSKEILATFDDVHVQLNVWDSEQEDAIQAEQPQFCVIMLATEQETCYKTDIVKRPGPLKVRLPKSDTKCHSFRVRFGDFDRKSTIYFCSTSFAIKHPEFMAVSSSTTCASRTKCALHKAPAMSTSAKVWCRLALQHQSTRWRMNQ